MEKLLNYLKEKYTYWCYIIIKDKFYILLRYELEDNKIVLSMLDTELEYYFEYLTWWEDIFIFNNFNDIPIRKYLIVYIW